MTALMQKTQDALAQNGIENVDINVGSVKVGAKESGTSLYQAVGISYWSEADGSRLAEHIKQAFEMPGGKERYWDQVPFAIFGDQYKVEIRSCNANDIVEIDTFRELKLIDKVYDV